MRKNYIYAIALLSLCVSLVFIIQEKDFNDQHKSTRTSEELIEQQIQHKIERRRNGYAKPDKPDKYLEYIHLLKTGGDPEMNYSINNAINELKSARIKSANLKGIKALDWKQRGPGNVGGRTRGLVIDPADATADTWFTGPVGGGVWKTTDGGKSWECLTPDWPNLSVSSLEMSQSNTDVMYAGTGEGFGNADAIKGNGIFKTIDRGMTWNQLSSTASDPDFEYVSRLAIDPGNENIIVAATNKGIFKSIDGGGIWTKKYEVTDQSNRVQDLRAHPDNFNVQFATDKYVGILASIDAGETWKVVKDIDEGRIELGIAKSNPDYMFALTEKSNLFLSIDGGDNWERTTTASKVEFLSKQGWYNNTLLANPSDENELFIGGLNLHKVTIGEDANVTGTDVYDVTLNNTSFIEWKDINGQYLAGGVKVDESKTDIFKDVVIDFGSGVEQKAHRFTTTSGVANPVATDFSYADYITVPFKVTDKTSGKQLMISFRDDNNSGAFEIGNGMEQIFIHSVDYSADAPSADITAETGGVSYSRIISLNPVLSDGVIWDAANLPAASIELDAYLLKSKKITSVELSVWYPSTVPNYSHADHHNIQIVEGVGNPFRIVNCNDGGVFISDDGGVNWDERVTGYVTTQFYGISRHPEKEIYLGGTQDNGSWLSPETPGKLSEWKRVLGGDGFETAWSAADANKMAVSLYNNEIYYTHDGQNWDQADIGDLDEDAPFVTRIANEASDPNLMFVGGKSGVWRSTDFGANWKRITMPSGTWNYGSSNPHVAISPVDSRYVWAGNVVSANDDLALSTDGGQSFTKVNSPAGVGAYISELVAHPTNEKGVYVLFAANNEPKIFYTDNLGETWTDLTQFGSGASVNGFPNVAVYSLVVMPYNTDIIWAGTEIGIFESTDGGLNWHYADNGLPAVCIWDMKFVGQQLVVGTHGLGVWTVDFPQVVVDRPPFIDRASKTPAGKYVIEVKYYKNYENVEIFIDDNNVLSINNVETGKQLYEIEYNDPLKVKLTASVIGYNGDKSQSSNYYVIENPVFEEPIQKYMNPFTNNKYDFEGADFTISKQLFNDWAIHSEHPYGEAGNFTYQLIYPIKIMEEGKAILSYRDIALVESGETGTEAFGHEDFFDYVIVEGTKDGINWVPLAPGYDVNYSSKWKEFADQDKSAEGFDYKDLSKVPKSSELFEEHTINLHDAFAKDDVIFIRFRLFSDTNSTGYGWVIDDLIIQETGTAVEEEMESNVEFAVGPNPASDYIELKLNSDETGKVNVAVYDMSGRALVVRDYYKEAGSWSQTIELGNVSAGTKIVTVSINGSIYKKKIVCR